MSVAFVAGAARPQRPDRCGRGVRRTRGFQEWDACSDDWTLNRVPTWWSVRKGDRMADRAGATRLTHPRGASGPVDVHGFQDPQVSLRGARLSLVDRRRPDGGGVRRRDVGCSWTDG